MLLLLLLLLLPLLQLFFCLPGAEAAVSANDWALFRQIIGRSCSQQQLAVYVQQLSEPGELAVDWGGGVDCSAELQCCSFQAVMGCS
jgi:hypothetical protein